LVTALDLALKFGNLPIACAAAGLSAARQGRLARRQEIISPAVESRLGNAVPSRDNRRRFFSSQEAQYSLAALSHRHLTALSHQSELLGSIVATVPLRRPDLFSPEKSSHATIPNYYELDNRAIISLACEIGADVLVIDDMKARKEARKRGIKSLWTLQLLDEAAERGLIDDLTERLEQLESQTSFYIGEKAKAVIDGMKQRDSERKLANEQQSREQPPGE
jgi:hypothetical protein